MFSDVKSRSPETEQDRLCVTSLLPPVICSRKRSQPCVAIAVGGRAVATARGTLGAASVELSTMGASLLPGPPGPRGVLPPAAPAPRGCPTRAWVPLMVRVWPSGRCALKCATGPVTITGPGTGCGTCWCEELERECMLPTTTGRGWTASCALTLMLVLADGNRTCCCCCCCCCCMI